MSPEDPLDSPAFRSSDESAAKGDADLDDAVDAAQHGTPDARTGRAGRDAGSNQSEPPPVPAEVVEPEGREEGEPNDREEEPSDVPDHTAVDPVPVDEIEAPAARDAAAPSADAGTSTVDASATPLPEAGLPPGTCKQATDCTQQCVPVGILHCCRDDGRCGCTWAPGAYCL